jgi:hypothetical protein
MTANPCRCYFNPAAREEHAHRGYPAQLHLKERAKGRPSEPYTDLSNFGGMLENYVHADRYTYHQTGNESQHALASRGRRQATGVSPFAIAHIPPLW